MGGELEIVYGWVLVEGERPPGRSVRLRVTDVLPTLSWRRRYRSPTDNSLATIAEVPICWVVTAAEDGRGANARAVRDCTGALDGADPWTRWFLAKLGSRRAAEIRRSGRVTLAGRADLLDDHSEVQARLRPANDPHGTLAAELVAVRVTVDRAAIHLRGVTAEPGNAAGRCWNATGAARGAWCPVEPSQGGSHPCCTVSYPRSPRPPFAFQPFVAGPVRRARGA